MQGGNVTEATVPNPYIIGRAITDRDRFFGRGELFQFINDQLHAGGRVILLIGQRRIGKSTILHQVPNFIDQEQFLVVHFDLHGFARASVEELLAHIGQAMLERVWRKEGESSLVKGSVKLGTVHAFQEQVLPQVMEALGPRQLLLLLDEFDVLEAERGREEPHGLFQHLSELLARESTGRLKLMAVIGRQPHEVPGIVQLFKEAATYRIGRLERRDSEELVRKPVEGLVEIPQEAVDAVYGLAAGHPYLTQLLCYELFNRLRREGFHLPTRQDVESVVPQALVTGTAGLDWFYEGLPPLDRVVFSALCSDAEVAGEGRPRPPFYGLLDSEGVETSPGEVSGVLTRLVDWDLAQREPPYPATVELVRRWIAQAHPLVKAKEDLEWAHPRVEELCEEADRASRFGDHLEAGRLYRAALELNRNHLPSLLGLSRVHLARDEHADALTFSVRAYKLDRYRGRERLVQALTAFGNPLLRPARIWDSARVTWCLLMAQLVEPSAETEALLAQVAGDPPRSWERVLEGFMAAAIEDRVHFLGFDAINLILEEVLRFPDPGVRAATVRGLARWAAQLNEESLWRMERSVSWLERAVHDPDEGVRREAARALGSYRAAARRYRGWSRWLWYPRAFLLIPIVVISAGVGRVSGIVRWMFGRYFTR
jgi:hypothetical protein